MEKLQKFVNEFYQKLNAKPDEFATCRIKLKQYLQQLNLQYGDNIQEQENQYLNQLSEENYSFLSIENDRGITVEYNEMKYFRKLADFIKKLKKQHLQSNYLPTNSPQIGRLSRDRLLEILTQEVNDLICMSQFIHPYSGIHQQLKIIEQQINLLKQIKQFEEQVQMKSPLNQPNNISKEMATLILNQDENFIQQLQKEGFHMTRISQVFYYQRYLLSYVLRSELFGLDLPPGFVIRLTLTNKPKRYQYYFVTQIKDESELNINKNEFAKHYLSLFVSDHLDHLVPKYFGTLQAFYGNAMQQQITQYEQFKNPLFHFKKDIFEASYDLQEFNAIKPKDIFAAFLKFLDFLAETQIFDFNYHSKTNQDRIKSMQISEEVISITYKRVKKMEDTFIYIQEVIFPQNYNVKLIQITQLLNPLFFQFMRLETSKLQKLTEYEDFINKLNLEEVMHKLVDGYLLIKYNNQLRELKQEVDKQNKQVLKSPSFTVIEFFQKLNINYDISLINRIKLIDYLAYTNFYNLDTQFKNHQDEIYDPVIRNFNKSWFDYELWKQAFQANYQYAQSSSQFKNTFLVELLAIQFLGNKFQELNLNLFESISGIDQTDEQCNKIILYLMNKKMHNIVGLGQLSIAESSLKHKKFNLFLKLLSIENNRKIRNNFFDYLLEDDDQLQKFHNQVFEGVEKYYPHLLGSLGWNYFWTQMTKQSGQYEFQILYKGSVHFTSQQYECIFNNNLLDNRQDLPNYLEVNLNTIINQNFDKHFALLNVKDNSLLFMQPNFPLQKYMAISLYKLISLDQFISKVELATHKGQIYSIYEVINTMIEGQRIRFTIAQYMLHHHFNESNLINKIGSQNLAYKILLSILLLPTNITPDQELLVPCGNYFAPVTTNFYFDPKHDNLINICGFEREGDKINLCCKNIYFLTQFMNEKIDPKYLSAFSNLTIILQQWLKQLSQLDLKVDKTQSILILPLNKENMIALIHRATLIQQAKQNITYLDLLKQCDPNLGEYYQTLINNSSLNLIQKFNELSSTLPICLTRQDFISFRESFSFSKYPSSFQLKNSIGPSKGLKMVLKYTRLLTEVEDFSKKLQIIKKPNHFQLLINSTDWRNLKESQVSVMLESLLKYSQDYNQPFEYVNFSCLSYRQFSQIFMQFELIRIKILNISYIDTITDSFINEICYKCSELHVLNISGCAGLIQLGVQKKLQFLRLKTLLASELPNIKSIEMSGQFLQNLNVNNCPQLTQVYTINQLNKIQAKGSKQLQQEIVEMWMLQGIQVIFDDITSNGAFKQLANKKIIKVNEEESSFQKTYVEFMFSLLGDIYEKFLFTDQNSRSPLPTYLVKSGIVIEDQQSQFLTFLSKQLDDKGKKVYIFGIFQCLFKNQFINTLELQSLICHKSEDKRKFLDQFLIDLSSIIESSIGREQYLVNQTVKQFLQNIEWITIPSASESVLEKIIQLLQQISYYKQFIKVSFANLKMIKSSIIEKYLSNLKQSDKYLHFPSLDFSGNSLTVDNLYEIFNEGTFSVINIQHLNLSNAGIDDNMLISISKQFWECENLRYIDLSRNQITSQGLNHLFEQALSDKVVKTPLNSLNLSHNSVGNAKFELLAKLEQQQWQNKENQMIYLKNLTLQNCFQIDQDISSFCKFLCQSYNLQALDLRRNKFNPETTQELSKSIGQNKSLSQLFFQNETIDSNLMFEELIKSQTLQYLDLTLKSFKKEISYLFDKLITLSITLPTIDDDSLRLLTKLYQGSQTVLFFDLHILDQELKQRTYYKLGMSKINYFREKKEQKETMLSEKFVKQDTLRIDVSDYSYTGLSLDGGGMRGLLPATILNYLCTQMKKEPYQLFDSIGGTSIGGMLALTMAGTKDGQSSLVDKDGLIKLFTEEGKTIFEDSKRGVWNIMSKSKYDAKGIENVLSRHCGTVKLSETIQNTNVIVTAVKLQKQRGETVAKVFSSRKAKVDLTENFLMKDVGRATSAAPTYFPAAQIKSLAGKEYQFIDGGIGVNNPSNFVLEDLRKCMLNRDQDNFFLLSLSTGVAKQKQQLQVDEGLLSVGKIIDAFGESNQDFVDLELKRHEGKYLRIIPEYDLQESMAQMDCTDPKVFEEYQQAALVAAESYFHKEIFGRYQDKSFIRWLEENTARRLESK
ncbi:unnamed protein product (macronuclear) [Paramecium tetraurelia]|uniref:PNPLA domain-containing protein n=1 Tax=Paramecium tetraurelia TaxID=5888 RepID=A0D162_PARTE|nr:uncharacterized protein GSPATT00012303001 [Paramecium tetraurelia]CAK76779.1 unnamed protein product [Paramecium tetraurelia]|eukprot:XP_001444176.1 hypothetical protein (macronuclear) [Paramecium tetraurelia strain d4-2]